MKPRLLRCPRDGSTTATKEHSGAHGPFAIDVCPTCGGVWFDKGEISRVTGEREVEHLIVAYAGGASGLTCPKCGRGMERRPVGPVVVDVCPHCRGIWFDQGELEEVVRGVAGEIPIEGTGLLAGGWGYWAGLTTAAFASPHVLKDMLKPRKSQIPEKW